MPRLTFILLMVFPAGLFAAPPDVTVRDTGTRYFENVPETPEAVRERLLPYLNVRSAFLAGWRADGGMLIRSRLGETVQVYRVGEPGGRREQLTFYSEPVAWAEAVEVDGKDQVLMLRDVGGDEDFQVYLLDPSDHRLQRLSDGHSRHGNVVVSPDGRHAAYYSTRRNGRDWDLYMVDLASGREREIWRDRGAWVPVDFDPRGRFLMVMQIISTAESRPYLLELDSGRLHPIIRSDDPVAFRDLAFAGNDLLMLSDFDREFVSIYRMSMDGGNPEVLVDAGWDVTEMVVSPDGRELVFVVNEEGYGRLRRLRLADGSELPLPALPDGVISQPRFDRDGRQLAFRLSAPDVSGDLFSIDLAGGELTRWTYSEIGGLDSERFVHPELIHYPTFDEVDGKPREIPAWVYRPRSQGPHPVVIEIHGGPAAQRRPVFSASFQYWVNELGLAVIAPNVRGSSGYGKTYLALDDGRLREDAVHDIGALLDWVADQPDFDENSVLVYGGSYGGYMVLASLMHFGDRLAGGVNFVGISNFVTFLENTRSYRRNLRRVEYGDERDPEMRAFLQRISPANQPQRLTRPLLVIHGLNDPRVPASEAEQIIAAMREAGHEPWYFLARDEGHGFRRQSNRIVRAEVETLFFRETISAWPDR